MVMVSSGVLVAVFALLAAAHAGPRPSITDIFSWGLDYIGTEGKSEEGDPTLATRQCSCEGPVCNCCVNFNVSFVDLGGPGCVKLKYLSQDEGLMVNVSYGDNVLHSEQVKGPKPEPACMDLLSDLAQVCARFTELKAEGDGLKGCTLLEPTLLGDAQAQYPVGCFIMGSDGMRLDPDHEPVVNVTEEEQSPEEEEEEEGTTDKPDLSEEALINAVNESAEEGIAWFTSLLGISFGGGAGQKNQTEAANSETATPALAATTPTPAAPPQQRQRSLNAIPV
ncbi:uncharacterized protein LOC124355089 [Homalodisca vitripennis]|uniref:uncharacterized protein LOC124355089 n=1 Tax=Homalodisca vitripennis TaxID=197043 RepID=UPI001EECACF5|nr:uncharacterized protein LOC124355089 [Homalodisca vitripennis]